MNSIKGLHRLLLRKPEDYLLAGYFGGCTDEVAIKDENMDEIMNNAVPASYRKAGKFPLDSAIHVAVARSKNCFDYYKYNIVKHKSIRNRFVCAYLLPPVPQNRNYDLQIAVMNLVERYLLLRIKEINTALKHGLLTGILNRTPSSFEFEP